MSKWDRFKSLDGYFFVHVLLPGAALLVVLALLANYVASRVEGVERPSGMKDGFYHALYECPAGNFSGFARWTGFKGKPSQDHNKWALYNEHRRYIIQIDSRCTVTILEGTPSIGSKENDP